MTAADPCLGTGDAFTFAKKSRDNPDVNPLPHFQPRFAPQLLIAVLVVGCSVDREALAGGGSGGGNADTGVPDAGMLRDASRDSGVDARVEVDATVGVDSAVPPDAALEDAALDATASECQADEHCPAVTCHEANCANGMCTYTPQPFGLADDVPQTPNDCKAVYCDGSGNAITLADSTDVPLDDGEYCTLEGCSNTTPVHITIANNTMLPPEQQEANDCKAKVCSGGVTTDVPDDQDRPSSTDCQDGTCNAGQAGMTPKAAGIACGGAEVCDDNGGCIGCLGLAAACSESWQCCGGDCVNGNCGAGCAAGQADCDGDSNNGCETPTNTLTDCAACGAACALNNATATCSTGACLIASCNQGFDDCNNDPSDGCEQRLDTLTSCGACGVSCSRPNATATCDSGTCVGACNANWGSCDSNDINGCETPTTTLTNCGDCGTLCSIPNAPATCASGTCTRVGCNTGYQDCDNNGANGCETPITTVANCGACGNVCSGPPNRTVTCAGNGTCSVGDCTANFLDCDGDASNGCEWDISGGACPCVGNTDSDGDGMTNCEELADDQAWTDPDIFNGATVTHYPLCSLRTFPIGGVNCVDYDTLGEVTSCINKTPRQTLNQYSGWDWDDPSGTPNAINTAGFGFLPNWSGTNTSFQLDARAFINIAQAGRHCFRVNGGSGGTCGSVYLVSTPASTFCGWSSVASNTNALVQHGDSAVCVDLGVGVYPIRWHLDRSGAAQGDFHLDYCFGGSGSCAPTNALPSAMLRASHPTSCPPPPANNCRSASYGGHLYWFCADASTWSASRAACQSAGMDLAAIGTSAENTFMRNNISGDHWVGLSKPSSQWIWVSTSTPISAGYTNWAEDEPNSTRVPNCGELKSDGEWNDTTCETAQAFVCEQL